MRPLNKHISLSIHNHTRLIQILFLTLMQNSHRKIVHKISRTGRGSHQAFAAEYAEALKQGAVLPPLPQLLRRRIAECPASVRTSSRHDAVLYSVGANASPTATGASCGKGRQGSRARRRLDERSVEQTSDKSSCPPGRVIGHVVDPVPFFTLGYFRVKTTPTRCG
jgi:hypothetical protein